MNRVRLGLAIRDDVAAIARTRSGRVLAGATAMRDPGEEWDAFLTRMIGTVPLRGFRRALLRVIVDDARFRVGPLHGESPDTSPRDVAARFAAAPEEYRVVGSDGAVAGNVWRRDDRWHGATLAAPLATAIAKASIAAGVELRLVGPAASGGASVEALATEAASLPVAGDERIDLLGPARASRRRQRWRTGGIAGAVAVVMVALAAPTMRAFFEVRALERELAALQVTEGGTTPGAEPRVAQRRAAQELRTGRGTASLLIDQLARALPESAAIVSLRIDESRGSLSVVAPRAADVVSTLVRLSALRGARLDGAVVSEDNGEVTLQRASLSWAGAVR